MVTSICAVKLLFNETQNVFFQPRLLLFIVLYMYVIYCKDGFVWCSFCLNKGILKTNKILQGSQRSEHSTTNKLNIPLTSYKVFSQINQRINIIQLGIKKYEFRSWLNGPIIMWLSSNHLVNLSLHFVASKTEIINKTYHITPCGQNEFYVRLDLSPLA